MVPPVLRSHINLLRVAWLAATSCVCMAMAGRAVAQDARLETISVFNDAAISYSPDTPHGAEVQGVQIVREGQAVQRTMALPTLELGTNGLGRVEAVIRVKPIMTRDAAGKRRPADPWSRMGALVIARDPDLEIDPDEGDPETNEIELVRFITGYGGESVFRQDVTALLPLLRGEVTLRAYVSTYMNPGWNISVDIEYTRASTARRPIFAQPIINNQGVISGENRVRSTATVPRGLDNVRLRLLTTGHATDGADGDEFTPRTNIVRVNGREVARLRPWASPRGDNRAANPMSGRITINGRELWSSSLDRAGWVPGEVVETQVIPLPGLIPGEHQVEIVVLGIRPEDASENYGYWRISAILVADEPWPPPGQ